mmetsp:Transcript_293/g.532  ORF Transcript_293/g.532 Transcript_293/m.532 type:complete len:133 (+) Transcript_293:115-513(+)
MDRTHNRSLALILRPPVKAGEETDVNLIVFGKGGCTERLSLDLNCSLALSAFHTSHISKTFHSKNITKKDPCFCFTGWARTIHNLVIWEDELVSESNGTVVDEGRAKGGQNERVKANNGFDNFEPKTKPENT